MFYKKVFDKIYVKNYLVYILIKAKNINKYLKR